MSECVGGCLFACVSVRVCVSVCVCVPVFVSVSECTLLRAHAHVLFWCALVQRCPPALATQTHTYTHRPIQTRTTINRHKQTHTDTHRPIQTHTDKHTDTQAHIHTQTHTQTHTYLLYFYELREDALLLHRAGVHLCTCARTAKLASRLIYPPIDSLRTDFVLQMSLGL